MSFLGWGSLDSVRSIHDTAEICGVVLFGLLVIAETVQIIYGRRERTLAEQFAQQQIEAAQTWHMSPLERQRLTAALSPFRGAAWVKSIEDARSKDYAADFVDLLIALHWMNPNTIVEPVMFQRHEPFGIQVAINVKMTKQEGQTTYAQLHNPAQALIDTLFDLGLARDRNILDDGGAPIGVIVITVCRRP